MPIATFFNAQHLPDPEQEYVAWLDVMGIGSVMTRSIRISANYVFKLHVAALEAPRNGVTLYPVMDGLYAASADKARMEAFLGQAIRAISTLFLDEDNPLHRFVVKGALAFGAVVHGRDLPADSSWTLRDNAEYRNQLLLGMPMVQAHQSETHAPPFGVFVHESARGFAPPGVEPFHNAWWHWCRDDADFRQRLAARLQEHYRWCAEHAEQLLYDRARIEVHRRQAEEYLGAPLLGG